MRIKELIEQLSLLNELEPIFFYSYEQGIKYSFVKLGVDKHGCAMIKLKRTLNSKSMNDGYLMPFDEAETGECK